MLTAAVGPPTGRAAVCESWLYVCLDAMNEHSTDRRPLQPRTLLIIAAIGAVTALLAFVIGRGTVQGMIAVFVVIGVGQRAWAHWYRKRHGLPR